MFFSVLLVVMAVITVVVGNWIKRLQTEADEYMLALAATNALSPVEGA